MANKFAQHRPHLIDLTPSEYTIRNSQAERVRPDAKRRVKDAVLDWSSRVPARVTDMVGVVSRRTGSKAATSQAVDSEVSRRHRAIEPPSGFSLVSHSRRVIKEEAPYQGTTRLYQKSASDFRLERPARIPAIKRGAVRKSELDLESDNRVIKGLALISGLSACVVAVNLFNNSFSAGDGSLQNAAVSPAGERVLQASIAAPEFFFDDDSDALSELQRANLSAGLDSDPATATHSLTKINAQTQPDSQADVEILDQNTLTLIDRTLVDERSEQLPDTLADQSSKQATESLAASEGQMGAVQTTTPSNPFESIVSEERLLNEDSAVEDVVTALTEPSTDSVAALAMVGAIASVDNPGNRAPTDYRSADHSSRAPSGGSSGAVKVAAVSATGTSTKNLSEAPAGGWSALMQQRGELQARSDSKASAFQTAMANQAAMTTSSDEEDEPWAYAPSAPRDSVVTSNGKRRTTVTVASGDTLSHILNRYGVGIDKMPQILTNPIVKDYLSNLEIGQQFQLEQLSNGDFHSLSARVGGEKKITITSINNALSIEAVNVPVERVIVTASGTIEQSLYHAAEKADVKQSTIMELADIFQWELDFAKDIRQGDEFSLVYNKIYREGAYVRDGEILAARFIRGGESHTAIRFVTDEGKVGYFTPEGESLQRAFRRHPVDVVRITSRFNPNRMHPVLHQIRAHRGVDYGAPYGSRIYATADGVVRFSGVKNAYGKTVVLQHGDKFSTLYAHMSRISDKAKRGAQVRQGDVIGYVGKTGRVTGVHLHYEFRVDGVQIDPLAVELPSADPVDPAYRDALKSVAGRMQRLMDRDLRNKDLLYADARDRRADSR